MFEFAENIFVEESAVRFYGFAIQTRMAVVRLSQDRLFLYSPVFLDAALLSSLEQLGRVAYIVSPNKIHNQALAQYAVAYPKATFFAPPGLPERKPELKFQRVLTDTPDLEWRNELDRVLTKGNIFFSEALFFHRKSRTLLVGDFVENINRDTVSKLAFLLARPFGVAYRPTASPEFKLYTHNAVEAEQSLLPAREWDFERIFLCHGGLIEKNAKAVFDRVCDELLDIARKRNPLSTWLTSKLASIA